MTRKQFFETKGPVYVNVQSVEFWIKTTKAEVADLAKFVGGWDQLSIDVHNGGIYVSVK